MQKDNFVSCKELYRVGDMVKYEYLQGQYSTAKILELENNTVSIKIGLPYSKKNDIYEDILEEIPYSKIIPFARYMELYKNK